MIGWFQELFRLRFPVSIVSFFVAGLSMADGCKRPSEHSEHSDHSDSSKAKAKVSFLIGLMFRGDAPVMSVGF